MSKAHISDLYFRDKSMRLQLPWGRLPGINISERALRLLIMAMAAIFLVTLASALISQMFENRKFHLNEQTQATLLHVQSTAKGIQNRLMEAEADGRTPPAITDRLLLEFLSPAALADHRKYVIADAEGNVVASAPIGAIPFKTSLAQIFAGVASDESEPAAVRQMTSDGQLVLVSQQQLTPYSGVLVAFQAESDILNLWRQRVVQLATLFGVTFLVLMLLTGAFFWQSGKAEEADSILSLATTRLDKALDGGACGLWDWDLAKGQIFWSRSMFEILGLSGRGELLSYGDIARRIHPDDQKLDDIIEDLLKGQRKVFDHEFRMMHEDGHWVWLRARAALSAQASLERPHLIGIVFDI